jgi:hypothetical protein
MFVFDLTFAEYRVRLVHKPKGFIQRKGNEMSKHTETLGVQAAMIANHEHREKLAKEVMADLGNGDKPGISLDRLTEFAREVIKLNKEFETLSARHRELMAK